MEQLISASGAQHGLIITPQGEALVSGAITATTSGVISNFGELGSSRVITNVVGVTPSGTFETEVTNLYAGSDSWVKEVPKTEVYVSGTINIGSVSANVDSIYVQSGVVSLEPLANPTAVTNPRISFEYLHYTSGTTSQYTTTGSLIGSIFHSFNTGSFVKSIEYSKQNPEIIKLTPWETV